MDTSNPRGENDGALTRRPNQVRRPGFGEFAHPEKNYSATDAAYTDYAASLRDPTPYPSQYSTTNPNDPHGTLPSSGHFYDETELSSYYRNALISTSRPSMANLGSHHQDLQTYTASVTSSSAYPPLTSKTSPCLSSASATHLKLDKTVVSPLAAVGQQFDYGLNTSTIPRLSQQNNSNINEPIQGHSKIHMGRTQTTYPTNGVSWMNNGPYFHYGSYRNGIQTVEDSIGPHYSSDADMESQRAHALSSGNSSTQGFYLSVVDAHRFTSYRNWNSGNLVPSENYWQSQSPLTHQPFPVSQSRGASTDSIRTMSSMEDNDYLQASFRGLPAIPVLSPKGKVQFQTRSSPTSSDPHRLPQRATPASSLSLPAPSPSSHQSHRSHDTINEDDAAICDICGEVASRAKKPSDRRSNLRRHEREKHKRDGQPKPACDECGHTFERSDNVRRHQRKFHGRRSTS